jgi:hypothetical protein
MRRAVIFMVVVVLVAGGCSASADNDLAEAPGGGHPPPPPRVDGEVLPVVLDHDPLPGDPVDLHAQIDEALGDLPVDASLTEQIYYQLRSETIILAGAMSETSADCEGRYLPQAGETSVCTVRYDGVEVRWRLKVHRSDLVSMSYTIEPEQVVLRATGVYDHVWHQFVDDEERPGELRCSEIPDIEVIDVGAETGYSCEYLAEDDNRWETCSVFSDDGEFANREGEIACA